MKSIKKEESLLKRYLKNKITLNTETVVKFLISGSLGLILTGCGGGSGGSGSSNGNSGSEKPTDKVHTVSINGKDIEIKQKVYSDGSLSKMIEIDGIKAELVKKGVTYNLGDLKPSDIDKHSIIIREDHIHNGHNLNGVMITKTETGYIFEKDEMKIELEKSEDDNKYTVINKGILIEKVGQKHVTHSISGENIINEGTIESNIESGKGMSGVGDVEIINSANGVILGTGEGQYETSESEGVIKDTLGTLGIHIAEGAKGINYGEINLNGFYTSGMRTGKNGKIYNEGNINIDSKMRLMDDSTITSTGIYLERKGVGFSVDNGMRAQDYSYAENNQLITGSGSIRGLVAYRNSEGVNNGIIELEGLVVKYEGDEEVIFGEDGFVISELDGMRAVHNSKGTNNGTIRVNGGTGLGMLARNSSQIFNKGRIEIVSSSYLAPLENEYKFTWMHGMRGTDESTVENQENGIIEFTGHGVIMDSSNLSQSINNGKLIGKTLDKSLDDKYFRSYILGMRATETSKSINNGLIDINGYGAAMEADGNSIIINTGDIIAETTGMELTDSTGENSGLIALDTNWGKGVLLDNSIFENKENGKIEIDGDSSVGLASLNSSIGENNGIINILGEDSVGMYASYNSEILNNTLGKIKVIGRDSGIAKDSLAMSVENGSTANNLGSIYLESVLGNFNYNSGYNGLGYSEVYGMKGKNSEIVNNNIISGLGSTYGLLAQEGSEGVNNGDITLVGKVEKHTGIEELLNKDYENNVVTFSEGMISKYSSHIENNGTISILEGDGRGMTMRENSTGVNKGDIHVKSSYIENENENNQTWVVGIRVRENSQATNEGNIFLTGRGAGMSISGNSQGINNGTIEVNGAEENNVAGVGFHVRDEGSIGTNNGIINVSGDGSRGMYAFEGGTVINGETGVINVSADAETGMKADGEGSIAINNGTINVSANHSDNSFIENGIAHSAMQSSNGGIIENNGTINIDVVDFKISSSNGGAYVIGTQEDGSYGKITGKNISIDGDVVVSTNIVKSNFMDKYTMQNVIDAEDITLEENFNFKSDSLLYDAIAKEDTWGNLDATLVRNDKTLSDFSAENLTSIANIFGSYQNEESFKDLSSDAKDIIKSIDTESVEDINNSLSELNPSIYSNIGRQILETSENFSAESEKAVESIGENDFNFLFVGKYSDVDSRKDIQGYDSKLSGFVGALKINDNLFGTLGYGYNDLDYKGGSKGNIETIHLEVNKVDTYRGTTLKLSLGGEYNFHENTRDISSFNREANSDFDSYGIRFTTEISKEYKELVQLKPFIGLDLAYLKYDSFSESGANSINVDMESEDYTSILPKVGVILEERFNNFKISSKIQYSYDLGDMDKKQEFSYEGFEGKSNLSKDEMESGLTTVSLGLEYGIRNFTIQGNLGKSFGKRDNSFADLSISYKF